MKGQGSVRGVGYLGPIPGCVAMGESCPQAPAPCLSFPSSLSLMLPLPPPRRCSSIS